MKRDEYEEKESDREYEITRRLEKLAHGIRTPLHTVLGTAELLNDDTLDLSEEAHVLTIIQAANSALTCLDRILTELRVTQVSGVIQPRQEHNIQHKRAPKKRKVDNDHSAYSILVVDDNRVSSLLAREMLERDGYQVKTAVDGREALDVFRTRDFDLVLLDLEMPILDGYRAHEKMRDEDASKNRRTPIVALTADSSASSAEKALRCGFDAYLVKPLARSELLEAVRTYLGIEDAE